MFKYLCLVGGAFVFFMAAISNEPYKEEFSCSRSDDRCQLVTVNFVGKTEQSYEIAQSEISNVQYECNSTGEGSNRRTVCRTYLDTSTGQQRHTLFEVSENTPQGATALNAYLRSDADDLSLTRYNWILLAMIIAPLSIGVIAFCLGRLTGKSDEEEVRAETGQDQRSIKGLIVVCILAAIFILPILIFIF